MSFFKKNNGQGGQPTGDLIEEAKKEGKKLGALIAALPMPDDTRQALLELLPNFSLEQLVRLSAILETAYLNQKTADVDKELVDTLNRINADYKKEVRAQEDKTLKALDELQNDLNKANE